MEITVCGSNALKRYDTYSQIKSISYKPFVSAVNGINKRSKRTISSGDLSFVKDTAVVNQEVMIVTPANNQTEISWYQENLGALLSGYENQWLAIQGNEVVGFGSDMLKAWQNAQEKGFKEPLLIPARMSGWGRDYD